MVTFDQIDAFLRAALFAMEHGYPDAAEVPQVADDLRDSTPRARGLVIQFPRKQEEGQ